MLTDHLGSTCRVNEPGNFTTGMSAPPLSFTKSTITPLAVPQAHALAHVLAPENGQPKVVAFFCHYPSFQRIYAEILLPKACIPRLPLIKPPWCAASARRNQRSACEPARGRPAAKLVPRSPCGGYPHAMKPLAGLRLSPHRLQ
jgi:hypothetical protein